MSSPVVANRSSNAFRDGGKILDEIIDVQCGEVLVTFHSCIEARDIGLVMFAMVNLHSLGVDVWLERIGGKIKWRKCVWHIYRNYRFVVGLEFDLSSWKYFGRVASRS